jgi:3-hydroxymyristoyl/3-hydroxydecanoyl-(acyl carrier protein) dehydratase
MQPIALDIAADHPVFAGHFPGAPLVPGALLLSLVLEAALADGEAAALVGPQPRLATAKFLHPVRPGEPATVAWTADARGLRFEVRSAGRVAASGHFEAGAAAAGA